ncbi:MAG: [FeFe] hydrogenase H-cluster radical SAM maturase HydE, partial [Deltaproteobacteria bacterium]
MSSLKFIDTLASEHNCSLYGLEKIIADPSNEEYLFAKAHEVRKRYVKSKVHLKALIEISNICTQTCYYCGLRAKNKTLNRYKMPVDEILSLASEAAQSGYKTIVLQSGQSDAYNDEQMCFIISQIKKLDVQITLSLGEKTRSQYKAYKLAGANRYLLRIETTNRALYKALHPNMSLRRRMQCLKDLQELGYETGSGLLVGLPNSSAKILARDLAFLKRNNFDMIGVG